MRPRMVAALHQIRWFRRGEAAPSLATQGVLVVGLTGENVNAPDLPCATVQTRG